MRRVRQMVVAVVVLLIVLLALGWWQQRRLLYFPDAAVPPVAVALPGSEEVIFTTADGHRLAGWFLPAGGDSPATVIVFNGNAGNRANRAPLAQALTREGLSVLLFDYRGYGGNPGSPSENGLLADARAARAYLASRPDVDASRIIYYGESLGTGVAVALAAESASGGPAGLILRSPFTSMVDVGRLHYWFLPIDLLLWDRYPSDTHIGRVPFPLIVIAGEKDELVPPGMSRRLYDAAPGPKQFVLVPGADHDDPRLGSGPEVLDALRRFLEQVPAQ
jgi:uncharacterized protein